MTTRQVRGSSVCGVFVAETREQPFLDSASGWTMSVVPRAKLPDGQWMNGLPALGDHPEDSVAEVDRGDDEHLTGHRGRSDSRHHELMARAKGKGGAGCFALWR